MGSSTSASSGMAKGLSYLGGAACLVEGILGRVLRLSSSMQLYILWVIRDHSGHRMRVASDVLLGDQIVL